jgi:hypothetical protein
MKAITTARGLGWFSIALGALEFAAPGWVKERSGIRSSPALVRLFGLRELGAGLAVLLPRRKAAGLWARVVGDVLDLAVLFSAFRDRRSRSKLLPTCATTLGVTALDLGCAVRLTRLESVGAT